MALAMIAEQREVNFILKHLLSSGGNEMLVNLFSIYYYYYYYIGDY